MLLRFPRILFTFPVLFTVAACAAPTDEAPDGEGTSVVAESLPDGGEAAELSSYQVPPRHLRCLLQPALPDLVVSGYSVVGVDGDTRVTVTLKNIGCAPALGRTYAFAHSLLGSSVYGGGWTPSSGAGTPAGDIPVDGTQTFTMLLGNSLSRVRSWGGTWRVEVDPQRQTPELNESNNVSLYPN